MSDYFSISVEPNWEGLVRCIRREGEPDRVYHIELFLDLEVQEAICQRFGVAADLDETKPFHPQKRAIAIQSFLGYDYVRWSLDDFVMPLKFHSADDTADQAREGGRQFIDEHQGPITDWASFEAFPWPDPDDASTASLEWFENNLPDNMCVIGSGGFAHFAEYLSWLMGYETLCTALCEQRDLVAAISERLTDMYRAMLARVLEFDCVKIVWGSDDMGFRNATLISPDDLREFVLPGHKLMADMSHAAGRPYLLHSCGNLSAIMEDLIEDVGIDAKHSFEDTIEDVVETKKQYGDRIAMLGGIDVDFLCRATEDQVRQRVRNTLEACMPGGGYVLGSGNSIANYIPLNNYLAMLDEGRKFSV